MSELKLPFQNIVIIVGRFVRDPHPLKGKDDVAGAAFEIAINKWVKGKPTVTTYVDCIAWNSNAEWILAHCGQGSPALIYGSLGNYEKTNGKVKVKKLQVSVASIQGLSKEEPEPKTEEKPKP